MDVVCLGILVADAIARPVGELPDRGSLGLVDEISLHGGGGCALNTASALARLGLSAGAAGKVGDDALGAFLVSLLDERGVDREGVLVDPAVATSATVVLVDADGERTFLHLPGASARVRDEELDRSYLFSGRCLHLAGALVMEELDGEPGARLLADAQSRGLLTSLDTVWRTWDAGTVSFPFSRMSTCSRRACRRAVRSPARRSRRRWPRGSGRRGVGEVVLKCGAAGCFALGESFEGALEALPVTAVDGTGAGDAFVAGLLYGRLAGWPLDRSARLANAVGALATTEVGAVEGLRGLEETLAFAGLSDGS